MRERENAEKKRKKKRKKKKKLRGEWVGCMERGRDRAGGGGGEGWGEGLGVCGYGQDRDCTEPSDGRIGAIVATVPVVTLPLLSSLAASRCYRVAIQSHPVC